MAKRVRLLEVSALVLGEGRVLPHAGPAPYRSILLVLGPEGPRGFFNVCEHLPVPLDGGAGEAPVLGGDWICRTHGARYELYSGYCHSGPCRGRSLVPLRLELEDGVVYAWVGDLGGPLL